MKVVPDRKYFLGYQVEAIMDEHPLFLWEKSIRIGATYAMAFRAVRRRVLGLGDCLVTSVSLPAAREFIEQCKRFNDIFKFVAGAIEHVSWGKELNEQGFCITYPNGKRIFAFSSNPKAIRSFGGEVMVDEFAFHQDPKEMLKAAGGRAMWGFPVSIWSSHNGAESEWNRLLSEERAKGAASLWHIRTTTIHDALEAGLLEKINATSGKCFTRPEFLAQVKAACGGEDAFEEECLCKPRRAGVGAVRWDWIETAKRDYEAVRIHINGDDRELVDSAVVMAAAAIAGKPASFGYDVARTGDLASLWIDAHPGNYMLSALVTLRGAKFSTQQDLIARIMRAAPQLVGAGDKTGLGMQLCEELEEQFGQARFIGVNFGQLKPELGTRLIKVFEEGRQELPRGEKYAEIYSDLAGIRTAALPSGRLVFAETRNPLNKDSHCDMAWSCALSKLAGENETGCGVY